MTYHQKPVAMPTAVRGALVLLLLFSCTFSLTSSACGKAMVRHVVRNGQRGCKKLTLIGCRGTCSSYTRVSPRDYRGVERSCECCQEVGYRTVKTWINCPQRSHLAYVRIPLECKCRPCNTLGGIDVPEEVRLADYFLD